MKTSTEIAESVNVSDTVGFVRYGVHGPINHGASVVTKKNKHGHTTLDNGKTFDKYGRERGTDHGLYLISTDDLSAVLAGVEARRDLNRRMSALKELVEGTIRGRCNGRGDYSQLTTEDKEKIIAAVDAV